MVYNINMRKKKLTKQEKNRLFYYGNRIKLLKEKREKYQQKKSDLTIIIKDNDKKNEFTVSKFNQKLFFIYF